MLILSLALSFSAGHRIISKASGHMFLRVFLMGRAGPGVKLCWPAFYAQLHRVDDISVSGPSSEKQGRTRNSGLFGLNLARFQVRASLLI